MTPQALNLIDNEWQPAQSGQFEDSVNPADGRVIGRYAASDGADAEAADSQGFTALHYLWIPRTGSADNCVWT